jgi:hypothetical protein
MYDNPFVNKRNTRIVRGKTPLVKKIFKRISNLKKKTKIIIGGIFILLIIIILIIILLIKTPINKNIEIARDGVHMYVNNNSNFTARFGYLTGEKFQHLVQYETKQNQLITMQLLNTKEDMKVYKTIMTQNKDNKVENIDVIKFEGIFDSTTVFYQVTNTRIKEVIEISSESAPSNFKYSVVTAGVDLLTQDGGQKNYIFKSGNKEIFGFPVLFMKDASNAISYDVESKMTFVKESNGENIYEFDVNPSLAWLKDKSRVFPIQIDPSIVKLSN